MQRTKTAKIILSNKAEVNIRARFVAKFRNLENRRRKKNSDYSEVRHLYKVHTLSLNNCGEIPTLSFIKEMQSLKDIRFVNTNIMDGNLAYCVGLRNVGFLSKRHYSHKPIDFTA